MSSEIAKSTALVPAHSLLHEARTALGTIYEHIREGRFQRSLSFVTAVSSLVSGIEVAYEHYKGSFSNMVMYTPVAMSGVLAAAAGSAVISRNAVKFLRVSSAITLADGIIGFGFHIRGIARKPGGWRLPITNIVMGPPLFAPLLFGTAAYLGFMASYLRREEDTQDARAGYTGWKRELHEGEFQKHLAAVAAAWTLFSGAEVWYSHYKSRFRIWSQWLPVALSPIQFGACIGAIFSETAARKLLPSTSALTMATGGIGFFYHARGILRRPGGRRRWLYNILYGPPIFAPLLFSACGFLGLLATVLRREKRG